MAHKDDYIKTIINHLSAVSGSDFQTISSTLLKFYYKELGLDFEKVGAVRGDYKNDGWIESKSIYYQMYSPEQFSDSFSKSLYSKFKDDFCGLCEHVYVNGKWSGKISKYYFLVNTRDRDIPHDEDRIVNTVKADMENKYGVSFDEIKICNKDDLVFMLNELDENQLESLTTVLGLSGSFEIISKTPKDYAGFMNALASALVNHSFNRNSPTDFGKIPDQDKIRINSLEAYENKIIEICAHLSAVEEAVEQYLQRESDDKKLNLVIKLYVDTYLELKNNYSGTLLYDKIIETICSYLPKNNYETTAEVFLVYIFDKCDIFERV